MKKVWIIGIVVVGLIALYAAWYLVSPLFIDNVVDEDLPFAQTQESDTNLEEEMQEPVLQNMYTGNFVDADAAHKTSGTALIISDNEETYLRFEDFSATNGPDLKVYLANDLDADDYVSLGELKGNIGNQNYELSDVEYEDYQYVLVWCEAFSVLFGYAELEEN